MSEALSLFAENDDAAIAEAESMLRGALSLLEGLSLEDRVNAVNRLREVIHEVSPFASEPVDLVRWIPAEIVTANDYNPNVVAPPEMRLLEHSIQEDGYTQPIVSWHKENGQHEVVDGFHRHRVGKESKIVGKRIHGYLPLVTINDQRLDKSDRTRENSRHEGARRRPS